MGPTRRCFAIRSHLNGFVLEIKDKANHPGAAVVTAPLTGGAHQYWHYHSPSKTIRSTQNDLCLDIGPYGVCIEPYQPGKDSQQWTGVNQMVKNKRLRRVLNIAGADKKPGAKVIAFRELKVANDMWDFVFQARAAYVSPSIPLTDDEDD